MIPLKETLRRWTLILGVAQILAGCLVGLVPPDAIEWFRAIVMAHLEYTANGILMIVLGLLLRDMHLADGTLRVWFASLQLGTWLNGTSGLIAGITGVSSTLLPTMNAAAPPPHGADSVIVSALLYATGVLILVALGLTLAGLVRGLRT